MQPVSNYMINLQLHVFILFGQTQRLHVLVWLLLHKLMKMW